MAAEAPEGGANGRFERMGRKMDQRFGGGIPRLEDEVRKMISYLDDQVVPVLRRNSSIGLRAAAERLRALAERLEHVQDRGPESSGAGTARENPPGSGDSGPAGDEPGPNSGEPHE